MYYKILTIDEYFAKYPAMKENEWFNTCFFPKNKTGILRSGILQFEENEWAIGGGFEGNCSIYTIRDYRKYFDPKGRKKVEITEQEYYFVNSPDMNDMIPFNLLSIKELVQDEIANNFTSIFTYPRRFQDKYANALKVVIGDMVLGSSNFPIELISDIEKELTPLEWKSVLIHRNRLIWSLESVSKEQPIKLRIDGIDDGAVEGLFESLEQAEKALKYNSFVGSERWELPFFRTD